MEKEKALKKTTIIIDENLPDSPVKVAIYGTLKKGHVRHRAISHCTRHENQVLNGLKMYHLGGYPGVVEQLDDEDLKQLEVEVYEASPEDVQRLDRIEGIPSLFRRVYSKEHDLYFYLYNHGAPEDSLIENNIWE